MKLKVKITNSSIAFWDITGRYDVEDNPEGWGTPNIDYSEVENAEVIVTNISTNKSITIDLTPVFQGIAGTSKKINLGEYTYDYEDGVISVEYKIKDIYDEEYEYKLDSLYTINIDCCIDKLLVDAVNLKKDDIYINKVLRAEAIRSALKKSGLCNNLERINHFLYKLNLICNSCATVK